MIQKKREEYQNIEGAGRPFPMHDQTFEPNNDEERQRPVIVHLADLNGQNGGRGMPKNFVRKAGRVLPTFDRYWTPDELEEKIEEDFDIQ